MINITDILLNLFKGSVYFVFAIALVLVLRRLLRILIRNTIARKKVLFYLPLLEFVLFFTVLIGTAFALVGNDKIIGSIIVLLLLTTLWKFLRNYISGIIFRLTNRDITGSMIKIDDVEGRISAYLMTSIAVKNEQDEVVKVPYISFFNKYTTSSINTESTIKMMFSFPVEVKEGKALEVKVKSMLLSSTWVVLSKEVSVNYSSSSNELNVSFYSLTNAYELEVKKQIEGLL